MHARYILHHPPVWAFRAVSMLSRRGNRRQQHRSQNCRIALMRCLLFSVELWRRQTPGFAPKQDVECGKNQKGKQSLKK